MGRQQTMEPSQIDVFRQQLTERRKQLTEELQHSDQARTEQLRAPGEIADVPSHNADRDSEGIDKELTIEEALRQELQRVEGALERIREGSFGSCQRCGRPIAPERLELLPHAPYCIDCEREVEALGDATAPQPHA